MIARLSIWVLAATVMMGLAGGVLAAPAKDSEELAAKREEDSIVLVAAEEDDDDDDVEWPDRHEQQKRQQQRRKQQRSHATAATPGVSRDRDSSRGDLTRDRTKDGPGGSKRDWSQNHTNDRSRNDTR